MKDKEHETDPENEVDRVIYDYLDTMLNDPSAGSVATEEALPMAVPDNVTPIQPNRIRIPVPEIQQVAKPKPIPEKLKPQAPVSRVADKPVALLSESLLQPKVEKAASNKISVDKVPVNKAPVDEAPQEIKPEAKKPAPKPLPEQPKQPESPKTESTAEEIKQPAAEAQPQTPPETQQEPAAIPSWAEGRFECLIFKVAGLKLAVPLITLGSIHQIDRKFNALPGQYDWFIGILQTPNSGNIKVLDTALCVMPERYQPSNRENLEYVITIHGYEWGLACHQVEQSITLEPEQVKWRSKRGKRPWLAGTVVDHMCSLIDTDGFQEIIQKAEQP